MDIRKKIVLGIVIVSVFIFLITVLVFVYALFSQGQAVPSILEPFLVYHIHFMVLMGLFGVISGLWAYSVLNSTLEKQKRLFRSNIEIIMKFLGPEDQQVVKLLLEKEGQTTQSEIAHLPGLSRLKAHRVVRKLEDRGIVHVEKHGKINLVRIVEALKGSS